METRFQIPLAIISPSQTPYRLHFHRRIARELSEIRLLSAFTHDYNIGGWAYQDYPALGTKCFGVGERGWERFKPRYAIREWRKASRIIRWLGRLHVRAVVVLGYNDFVSLRVIRWCRKRGVTCILFGDNNIHGDTVRGIQRVAKNVVVSRVLRETTAVLACGSLGVRFFERYGADPGRIFLSPYEPDYDLIQHLPEASIDRVRAAHNITPGRRHLLYCGRLAAEKRVDLAVRAFLAVADDRPEWDLVIVGDGPLRSDLTNMVPSRLSGRIRWIGFLPNPEEVAAVFRSCDMLVLPSDFEPWALVVNEALAAGLAVVASSVVGAAADLVRNHVNGRLFCRGDLADLTQCLHDAMDGSKVDEWRVASSEILESWREIADPVTGLRSALQFAGIL